LVSRGDFLPSIAAFDNPKNSVISKAYHHTFRESSNYMLWQVIYSRATVKFRAGSKHIINIAEFQINKSGVRLIC
jgi:hypothetical protein